MLESIPALFILPIAKAVFENFYNAVGSKLGEKAVEIVPDKAKKLGQLIWSRCLRQKSGADQLLERAANGSEDDQKKLTEYLQNVLEKNPALKQEAQKIAEEIQIEVNNDFGQMTQINRDQSTGYQTKTGANNTNFFGGTHHHS